MESLNKKPSMTSPSHRDDWRSLYPFASNYFDLDGESMHYLDERGEGAHEKSGTTLLFVHGNPTWSFYWRELIVALRKKHRAVAVDHIGCGLSDKPQHYNYTLSKHIDNLTRFVEELDLSNITLVVHDWGGAIGLGTALALPERFSRLVLTNTAAFPPPFIPWRIRACRIPVIGTWAVRRHNIFARAALRMATTKPGGLTGKIAAGLLSPYDSYEHRVAIDRFVQDIPRSSRHPTWATLESIEAGLPSLADRPCLMFWGMRDWCFRPECLERLLQHLPNAQVHRFATAGHYVVEDAHQQIVPVLRDWLEGGV